MMKKYKAYLVLDNVYQSVDFETDLNPIEFLWTRFGMDTYIDSLEEIFEEVTEEEEAETEEEEAEAEEEDLIEQ